MEHISSNISLLLSDYGYKIKKYMAHLQLFRCKIGVSYIFLTFIAV
nr:MAG TPA: hypothetical protein [Caudoviricetes sp.]